MDGMYTVDSTAADHYNIETDRTDDKNLEELEEKAEKKKEDKKLISGNKRIDPLADDGKRILADDGIKT